MQDIRTRLPAAPEQILQYAKKKKKKSVLVIHRNRQIPNNKIQMSLKHLFPCTPEVIMLGAIHYHRPILFGLTILHGRFINPRYSFKDSNIALEAPLIT